MLGNKIHYDYVAAHSIDGYQVIFCCCLIQELSEILSSTSTLAFTLSKVFIVWALGFIHNKTQVYWKCVEIILYLWNLLNVAFSRANRKIRKSWQTFQHDIISKNKEKTPKQEEITLSSK